MMSDRPDLAPSAPIRGICIGLALSAVSWLALLLAIAILWRSA